MQYDESLESMASVVYQECLAMQAEAAEYGLLLPAPRSIGYGESSAKFLNELFEQYVAMFAALESAKDRETSK